MMEEDIIMTFEDHAAYADAPRRSVLSTLRGMVHELDPRFRQGEGCTPSNRITYKFPDAKNLFLEVKVQRSAILMRVRDVRCTYPAGITSSVPENFGWGKKKQIRLSNVDDLNAAIPCLKAAYRAYR